MVRDAGDPAWSFRRTPARQGRVAPRPGPHTGRVDSPRTPESAFTVLLVCTGNICRSPLAERIGRAHLADRLGLDGGVFRLHSAGTAAVVGSAMHPHSALVLRGLGGEPDGFVARQVTGELAAGSDLTLTMTREQRRQVLHRAPRQLARTFTLREAASLLGIVGEDVDLAGETLAQRGRGLVREMAAARPRRVSDDSDDVRDPIGFPIEVHQQVGELIAGVLLPLLTRFAALDPDRSGSGVPAP